MFESCIEVTRTCCVKPSYPYLGQYVSIEQTADASRYDVPQKLVNNFVSRTGRAKNADTRSVWLYNSSNLTYHIIVFEGWTSWGRRSIICGRICWLG